MDARRKVDKRKWWLTAVLIGKRNHLDVNMVLVLLDMILNRWKRNRISHNGNLHQKNNQN